MGINLFRHSAIDLRTEGTNGYNCHNSGHYQSLCILFNIHHFGSRRMRWAGHVTRIGEKRNVYRLTVGTQRESYH
jgi:hypothetical protein